jgi:hypothetical protein
LNPNQWFAFAMALVVVSVAFIVLMMISPPEAPVPVVR